MREKYKAIPCERYSEDWVTARAQRITGKGLVGVLAGPETARHKGYREKLVNELFGIFDESEIHPESWIVKARSKHLAAMRAYRDRYPDSVTNGSVLVHRDYAWMCCSPNGFTDAGYPILCRSRESLARLREGPDISEMRRAQYYLLITGAEFCVLANYYNDGRSEKLATYPVPAQDNFLAYLVDRVNDFWHSVLLQAREKKHEQDRRSRAET
jgi:hypothetical protein